MLEIMFFHSIKHSIVILFNDHRHKTFLPQKSFQRRLDLRSSDIIIEMFTFDNRIPKIFIYYAINNSINFYYFLISFKNKNYKLEFSIDASFILFFEISCVVSAIKFLFPSVKLFSGSSFISNFSDPIGFSSFVFEPEKILS